MGRTIRRRRHENKTDYKARFGLLKSEKARLVVRKTNRYIIAQLVQSDIAQDKVIVSVMSKDLIAKGWPKELSGSLKSLPAAYLTGMLIASKAKAKEAILDMGMYRNVKKSRIYAVLRGAIDGGISIPASEEAMPQEEEIIRNDKLKSAFDKVKKEIQNG